jgi:DNA topoisomerase-1
MKLVIVESPTKAKTLRKFLGNDYVIEASMGHIRDLPKSSLGVDVTKNFEPEYEVSKGKSQVITKLKKDAETAEKVYLATDPDREGEAISWHIKYLLQQNGRKKTPKVADDAFARVTFHEITKSAIEAAIQSPSQLNMAMVDAQQARRVLDRLVGYTLSPVLWRKVRRGLSAGRVQSVAVRMIVEREREIRAFKPQEYWDIAVDVATHDGGQFQVVLTEVDGEKVAVRGQDEENKKQACVYIDSSVIAEPIIEGLKISTYQVVSIERKEQQKKPVAPFTTSTLQQAAANVLGWSGKMTMQMAQELYEAGLITYHRTDSVNLAKEAVEASRAEIARVFGAEYVPETPNIYQTKSKNAQEAHEAIRPTRFDVRNVISEMREGTERHQKLYQLIWRRFMACQMKPAIYDQTAILVKATPTNQQASLCTLRASGSVVRFDGWKKAYEQADKKTDETILPSVAEQEQLTYKQVVSEQKFTQPPARYNDASLIKELEKRGIGRPSTYATILSTIVDRGYVERVDRRYSPTSIGEAVNDFLVTSFAGVMDYEFTAEMEEELDQVALGKLNWREVMKAFWTPFEKAVKTADKGASRVEIPVEKTGEKCPKCHEGELVVRTGKFGKFLSCGRFPECDYKASLKQTVPGVVCPTCGAEIVQKRTRTGRTFWGCSAYPTCKWASWQDPSKKQDQTESPSNTQAEQ